MILAKLFGIFFVVNLFTIGGGYVMLPILQDYFVGGGFITQKEFIDAVALGQVTPGPLTIMNAFIGYKVQGVSGAVAATLGSYVPSMIVVTLVTKYYLKFRETKAVDAVFRGIKPAVAGMLAAVMLNLVGTSFTDYATAGIGAAVFFLITFTKVEPTVIIIAAGAVGAAVL